MEQIASKLNYLKGLLKGVEINGGKKNIIIEEIIAILELMNKEMIELRREESLPLYLNKKVDCDYYNDKTMRRSDFTSSMDSGDIWYDESLSFGKYPEPVSYRPNNKKILLEKLCKHCGTFVRAEFSAHEYERVKIQCPKCKHFILPDQKNFSWDDKSVRDDESFDNEYSFKDLIQEASRELTQKKTNEKKDFSIAKVEDEILFNEFDIERDIENPYENAAPNKYSLDDFFAEDNDEASDFDLNERSANVLEEEGYLMRFH